MPKLYAQEPTQTNKNVKTFAQEPTQTNKNTKTFAQGTTQHNKNAKTFAQEPTQPNKNAQIFSLTEHFELCESFVEVSERLGRTERKIARPIIFINLIKQFTEYSIFIIIIPLYNQADMNSSNIHTEQHPHFPSGIWQGFYMQYGTKHEMATELNFMDGKISGDGSDALGSFYWSGNYDAQQGQCSLFKTYPGHYKVSYQGHADENGIWGFWHLAGMRDGFHIWPKDAGSQESKSLHATSSKQLEKLH